jgi:hypothetical protein
MLPAWATVTLTLGALFLGGLITFMTGWAQSRRDRVQATERLGEVAVAGVAGVVVDTSPEGVALDTREATIEYLDDVGRGWQSEVRPALLEFSVRTDSDELRRLARALVAETPGLVAISGRYAQALIHEAKIGSVTPVSIELGKTQLAKHRAVSSRVREAERAIRAHRSPSLLERLRRRLPRRLRRSPLGPAAS